MLPLIHQTEIAVITVSYDVIKVCLMVIGQLTQETNNHKIDTSQTAVMTAKLKKYNYIIIPDCPQIRILLLLMFGFEL